MSLNSEVMEVHNDALKTSTEERRVEEIFNDVNSCVAFISNSYFIWFVY